MAVGIPIRVILFKIYPGSFIMELYLFWRFWSPKKSIHPSRASSSPLVALGEIDSQIKMMSI